LFISQEPDNGFKKHLAPQTPSRGFFGPVLYVFSLMGGINIELPTDAIG
jgi:hypothetical protein